LNPIAIGSLFIGTNEASAKLICIASESVHCSPTAGRCALSSRAYCYFDILALNDQTQGTIQYYTRVAACPEVTSQSGICCALQGTISSDFLRNALILVQSRVAGRGARRLCFTHGIPQHIFGGCERIEADIDPQRHVDRDGVRRTLLHAREIQHITTKLLLGLAHDPHVPSAISAAVTICAAFAFAIEKCIVFTESMDWHVAVLASHLPPESSKEVDLTVSFVCGTLEPGNAANIIDISYELNTIKLLIHGLSPQWSECMKMKEVVDAKEARCMWPNKGQQLLWHDLNWTTDNTHLRHLRILELSVNVPISTPFQHRL
jgi:hypothetical protein